MRLGELGVGRGVSRFPLVVTGIGAEGLMIILVEAGFGEAQNMGLPLQDGVLVVVKVGGINNLEDGVPGV